MEDFEIVLHVPEVFGWDVYGSPLAWDLRALNVNVASIVGPDQMKEFVHAQIEQVFNVARLAQDLGEDDNVGIALESDIALL
jgi:hypothetical protein